MKLMMPHKRPEAPATRLVTPPLRPRSQGGVETRGRAPVPQAYLTYEEGSRWRLAGGSSRLLGAAWAPTHGLIA